MPSFQGRPPLWLMLILLGCQVATPRSGNVTQAVEQAFDSLNAALDTAYRRGDATAVAALFTPDATLSLIGLADLTGRDAITTLLTPLFTASVVHEFRLRAAEIEAYDSVAYERGVFVWSASPRGQVPTVERGRYSMVRRKTPEGRWLIHRFLENAVPASDSAAGSLPRAG